MSGGPVGDSRTAARFHAERLFETQRVAVIVIVVAVPAEWAVARFFVARNGAVIVLMHLKPHRPASAPPRRVFGRGQQQRSDAAPADMRSDGDGIKPGEL